MAGVQGSLRERGALALRGTAALGIVVAIVLWLDHEGFRVRSAGGIYALGLLLLAGHVAASLVALVRLPRLTGYLLAGILLGPHALHWLDHEQVASLSPINHLALALIALEAGAELTTQMVRRSWKTLLWQSLTQTLILATTMAGVFLLLAWFGWIDFLVGAGTKTLVAIAVVWGAIAVSKSPAATLAILKESRAKGPVSEVSLGVVVLFDVIVLVLFAGAMMWAKAALTPDGSLSMSSLVHLAEELGASVAAGTTFGLGIALYFWLVNSERLLFLLVVAYGVTAFCTYFHYDTLLVFAVAGFVVRNLSRQGMPLVHESERMGSVVMIVFFASAGAHLDLGVLVKAWPVALTLAGTRVLMTWVAARAGHRLGRDPEVVSRWSFTALVSQAGVTIGLATIAANTLGDLGVGLATLSIAVVGINEVVGPIVFKIGLARAGEVGAADAEAEGASVHPLPPPPGEPPPRSSTPGKRAA